MPRNIPYATHLSALSIYNMMRSMFKDKNGLKVGKITEYQEKGINPYRDMCYIMSNTIYELLSKNEYLSLYRCKDYKDDWHWFVMIDRADIGTLDFIDPSAMQYYIDDKPCPTDVLKGTFDKDTKDLLDDRFEKHKGLWQPSYKDKTKAFMDELLEYREIVS